MRDQNPYEASGGETHESRYDRDVRMWAMLIHLSVLAGNTVPLAGWILPIAIWQIKKDEMPELDRHGKIVVNWLISALIFACICVPLCFAIVGIPLLFLLYFANILFAVVGGVKANNGEAWDYPCSFQFVR